MALVVGLSQLACGGSQAERALAGAAAVAALEVAGAALQAAANDAAARDSQKRARNDAARHTPADSWRLVRHEEECESDVDDECEDSETGARSPEVQGAATTNSETSAAENTPAQPASYEATVTLGPCIVCR